jgi:hypothetical protein
MSDIFFPRVYLRRGVIPAGTISMTTYFHADSQQPGRARRRLHLGDGSVRTASTGDSSTRTRNCGVADGDLLATTYQIVYFKG